MTKTLSISEARKKIFDIAKEVQKPDKHFVLTDKGEPKAVILSAEEYDSLMETMDILSDPNALQKINKAEAEYKKGEYSSWSQVKKNLGYDSSVNVVADRSRKKYGKK
ncbi:MAG: type II toxin-antitoxin system Phd/YefM family antitoxin [Patescibacteria group bacterium]